MADSAPLPFFDRLAWDAFIDDIKNKYLGPENSTEELHFIFDRLHRAIQRKSAIFWHHLYLKKYMDQKKYPLDCLFKSFQQYQ